MTLEEQTKLMWEKSMGRQTLVGTPKTLDQSILNALAEIVETDNNAEEVISKHVRDYLSQKFQLFMNGSGDAVDTCSTAIWNKIMGINP